MTRGIILTLLLIALFPQWTWAACSWNGSTGTVASPFAYSDLQDCVTDASSKTGVVTIQIPDSTVTWSSYVTVNMKTGFSSVTSLHIRGQNDCSLATNEITSGIPTSCGTNIEGFDIGFVGSTDKKFRLSNMRIYGTSSGISISIDGDSTPPTGGWQIDHIFFDTQTVGNRVIWFNRTSTSYGLSNGLINNCYVLNPSKIFLQYQPQGDGGNSEWIATLGLGTYNAVYVEDSKFYFTTGNGSAPSVENQGAGRMVIRKSIFHNAYLDAHDAIVNGFRGVRKMEVYSNTVTYDVNKAEDRFLINRGGSGVFYNNTITGPDATKSVPVFAIYRYNQAGGNPWEYAPNAAGPAYTKAILGINTNYPQSCSSGTGCIDIDGAGGYPSRDQLGVDGNDPQVAGSAPFLAWNNTYNASEVTPSIMTGYGQANMVDGTDYCYHATTKPACGGFGTSYTPYTYPHPLRGEAVAGISTLTGATLYGGKLY
jgi:hypothetical protein